MFNSKMMNVRFISIISQMVILEKQNIYIEKRIIRVQVIRYSSKFKRNVNFNLY